MDNDKRWGDSTYHTHCDPVRPKEDSTDLNHFYNLLKLYANEYPVYSLFDVNCQRFAAQIYNDLTGEETCGEYQSAALDTVRGAGAVGGAISNIVTAPFSWFSS